MTLWGLKTGRLAILIASTAVVVVLSALMANAGGLKNAGNGTGTNGNPTGNVLFGYFNAGIDRFDVIDPNGCGNGLISNAACHGEVDTCAMFYVFDAEQELQTCCGCLLTPNELAAGNILSPIDGVLIVVGSAINNPGPFPFSCANPGNPACSGGCDASVPPITAGATNLIGSVTQVQTIGLKTGLTEIPMFDQGNGDAVDNAYLVNECGALLANGGEAGTCGCD